MNCPGKKSLDRDKRKKNTTGRIQIAFSDQGKKQKGKNPKTEEVKRTTSENDGKMVFKPELLDSKHMIVPESSIVRGR